MPKSKREKCNYLNYTFTIFKKYDTWQISFKNPKDVKMVKRSTGLAATAANLITVKKEIIPSVVEYLTGKIQSVEEEKEYTLSNFADEYFVLHRARVREHTHNRNLLHFQKHIKPYFGHRLLDTIKPMELEKWQNDFKSKKYKPLTIQKFRSILFSIFDEAIKNDIINTNPLSKVEAPKINKEFKMIDDVDEDIFPFSEDEIKMILDNSDSYLKNFIMLMYATGVRPGEIIALQWTDISFDKKQIHISKTISSGKIGLPKTAASVRKVDMLPLAELALKEQYKLTKDYEYIFISSSKKAFYSHDIINIRFKKILKSNNIQVRALYNLRHTFASQLISSGEDIVWVSRTLGHNDVSITLKYYTKFIKEDEETRLKKISKIGANFGANIFRDS
ncbi:MAG: site-specific integrase [Sulfurimonas sp.]